LRRIWPCSAWRIIDRECQKELRSRSGLTKRYRMADRYIEQAPENVIWKNMSLNPYEATIRKAISYAITVGMIVLWTFPGQFD
jgi:hypothetical protein